MSTLIIESGTQQVSGSAMGRRVLWTVIFWFFAVLAVVLSGGFNAAVGERPLVMLLAIVLPILLFSLAYAGIDALRDWVLNLDMRHLVLIHSWRMLGMGFVFLYFHEKLPALFALPAGLGDAMAAMGALYLGIALYENMANVSNTRIFMWNTFGLIDFIVAVAMGVLTRSGDILHFSGQAGSDIMGTFPLALIPGFAVPFYFITHLIIYAQLNQRKLKEQLVSDD